MSKIFRFGIVAVVAATLAVPSIASADQSEPYVYVAQGEPKGSFEQIGHSPLNDRGMNAALAVHGDYAYVGIRTDAKANNANGAGVLVVDISKPEAPEVVHEIGPPNQGNEGETSREMRVLHDEELLIVMNLGSNCSYLIHACSPRAVQDNYRFYDISGKNAAEPKLVAEYKPSENPHEFYIWEDPRRDRTLMFQSTPSANTGILVTDITDAAKGKFKEIATMPNFVSDGYVHSMMISNDGKRAYIAYNSGGFFVVDTSEIAAGKAKPKFKAIGNPEKDRADWDGPSHSSIKLYGSDYVLNADEVYGDLLRALGSGGCPWGWVRMIDVSNEAKPKIKAEYKLPQNEQDFCSTDAPRPSSSYASHNPTITPNLAILSWHAGGLQAIDISNPAKPTQAAEWKPDPLPAVLQEDPALSAGQDKVVVWSFPIIQDGLIYVVDIRNGLYILKYKGPYEKEISSVDFLEGNSNQGDATRWDN